MEDNRSKVKGVAKLNAGPRQVMLANDTFNADKSYEDYINAVYGATDMSVDLYSSIMFNNGIPYLEEDKGLGVIRDANVNRALEGEVISNPNYKGFVVKNVYDYLNGYGYDISMQRGNVKSDTKIGILGSHIYGQMMQRGAILASKRGRNLNDNVVGQYAYLTPHLFYEYGNNLYNMGRLEEILPIHPYTGKAINDLATNVGIMSIEDSTPENNGSHWYLMSQYDPNKKYIDFNIEGRNFIYIEQAYIDNEMFGHHIGFDGQHLNKGLQSKYSNSTPFNLSKDKTKHLVYDDISGSTDDKFESTISEFDTFDSMSSAGNVGVNNLLGKTKKLFDQKSFASKLGEFWHKPFDGDNKPLFDSAYDSEYGNAKGRNLFNKTRSGETHKISNPYCRVWTYHSQYSRYRNTIRPFTKGSDKNAEPYKLSDIQGNKAIARYRAFNESNNSDHGGKYLSKYSVLRDNGFVKIGAYNEDWPKFDTQSLNGTDNIHKYMLSIENLAWKDFRTNLEVERLRLGPNGGRIMWFPPYDLEFSESVSVNWNEINAIGRGENMYTYSNTVRNGSLSFVILIDHPSIVESMAATAKTDDNEKSKDGGIDADILRYFAGCDTFEFINGKEQPVSEDKNDQLQNEPELGTDKLYPVCKFPIFFPNNYSGHKDNTQDGIIDGDWVDYLLKGRNVNIPENGVGNGYELVEGNGISDDNFSGETIRSQKETPGINKVCTKNDDGNHYFQYRVDCNLRQNGLVVNNEINNYKDSHSFGLNLSLDKINTLEDKIFEGCTCSFAEFAAAIDKNYKSGENGYYQYVQTKGGSQARIDHIIDLMRSGDLVAVRVVGGATEQDAKNAGGLSESRRNTALKWVDENLVIKTHISDGTNTHVFINNSKEINSLFSKQQRCAVVTLYSRNEELYDAAIGTIIPDDINQATTTRDVTQNKEDYYNSEYYNTDIRTINVNTNDDVGTGSFVKTADKQTDRYSEYEYFKELSVNDPMVFKSIKDKFKYFDPAYHSMSPEGFNARLNFLHQCTRQGHTISVSELTNYAATAGNLAFGRMPVCVLRIGDFIHSRMIIQSMSIQYSSNNGMTWDLNPEGAGVQPLYAKVSMNIILIGGSALNMPVNRLQNAQSFNYYANTGVYDERADRVIRVNGTEAYENVFVPTFNNTKTATTENKKQK